MSFVDEHRRQRDRGLDVLLELMKKYRPTRDAVYGIVEGNDDPSYYRRHVEERLPSGWVFEPVVAGSKARVVSALKGVDWSRYSRTHVAFFIDRDLDEFIGSEVPSDPNCYVTDGYSIETELAEIGVVRSVMVDFYGFTWSSDEQQSEFEGRFNDSLTLFLDVTVAVMAQFVIWMRAGEKPQFNRLELSDVFQFDDGRLVRSQTILTTDSLLAWASRCQGIPASSATEVQQVVLEMTRVRKPLELVRGKMLLWFLRGFMESTWTAYGSLLGEGEVQPKRRGNFGLSDAVLVLAPRTRCPQGLQEFLARTYLATGSKGMRIGTVAQH